jgi:chromate transporter
LSKDAPSRPPVRHANPVAPIGLWRIFAAFLWLGGTSFGGGMAGWLYREMVQRRGWLDDTVFLEHLALGQAIPGSNGIKLTVLVGQRLHGTAGACVALLGLMAAPFAVAIAIGAAYGGLGDHRIVQAMLDGVAAAVIGLTFATGWRSLAQGATGPAAWLVAALTVLCVGLLRWPIFPVLVGVAPLSIGLAALRARRG